MISAPQVPTQHFWCHPLRQWAILIPHESVHHEVLLKRRVIDLWCNRSLQLISYEFFRYCGGLCSEPLWISWLSNFIMIDWEADRTHRVIYSTHLFFFFFLLFAAHPPAVTAAVCSNSHPPLSVASGSPVPHLRSATPAFNPQSVTLFISLTLTDSLPDSMCIHVACSSVAFVDWVVDFDPACIWPESAEASW